MTKFSATFSNGKTVTRTSWHPYKFAVALVHKATGEIINVKFTASDKPQPDWGGLHRVQGRYYSQRERDRLNAWVEAERTNWNVEIVEAKVVS